MANPILFSGFDELDFLDDFSLDELDSHHLDSFGADFEDPTTDFSLPTAVPVLLPASPSTRKCVPVKMEPYQAVPNVVFQQFMQQVPMPQTGMMCVPSAFPYSMEAEHQPSNCMDDGRSSTTTSPISRTTSFDEDPESSGYSSYSDSKASPLVSDDGDEYAPKRRGRKRKCISDEERQRLTRERNREHARTTRERKKQHIDHLKEEVANLLRRRQDLLKMQSSVPKRPDSTSYANVVTQLLTLRFGMVTDQKQWSELVAPGFQLHLPSGLLPGQDEQICGALPGVKQADGTRVLSTMTQVLQDVAHLHKFHEYLEKSLHMSAPSSSLFSLESTIHLFAHLNMQSIIVTGDSLMGSWTLHLRIPGCPQDLVLLDGMLECSFASDGRIQKLELAYDVQSLGYEVQHLAQQNEQRQLDLSRSTFLPANSSSTPTFHMGQSDSTTSYLRNSPNLVDFSDLSASMRHSGNYLQGMFLL